MNFDELQSRAKLQWTNGHRFFCNDEVFRNGLIDLGHLECGLFTDCVFEEIVFANCNLRRCQFLRCIFKRVNFENCDMAKAIFTKCTMEDTEGVSIVESMGKRCFVWRHNGKTWAQYGSKTIFLGD